VVLPKDEDQHMLHEWIYRLKAGSPSEDFLHWIDTLASRYEVRGFLFGCTELHLLGRLLAARPLGSTDVIDPLWTAARELRRLLKS
jgi:aspartate/glutamate racemase